MSQADEIKELRERQERLELEIDRLRRIVEPVTYLDWWSRLDNNWKILMMHHVRSERTWDDTWRWASDWEVAEYKPTPRFWEKLIQIRIFGCALQRHHSKITSLEPLARTINLVGINCRQTDVDDLEPIAHLTKVQYLDINATYIDDLRPITGWSGLEVLNYQHGFSQDKDDLSCFPNLKYLNVRYGQLRDLDCLAALTELDELNIAYTGVNSLKPLYGHTKLKKIYLRGTHIPEHEIVEFNALHPNCNLEHAP